MRKIRTIESFGSGLNSCGLGLACICQVGRALYKRLHEPQQFCTRHQALSADCWRQPQIPAVAAGSRLSRANFCYQVFQRVSMGAFHPGKLGASAADREILHFLCSQVCAFDGAHEQAQARFRARAGADKVRIRSA